MILGGCTQPHLLFAMPYMPSHDLVGVMTIFTGFTSEMGWVQHVNSSLLLETPNLTELKKGPNTTTSNISRPRQSIDTKIYRYILHDPTITLIYLLYNIYAN